MDGPDEEDPENSEDNSGRLKSSRRNRSCVRADSPLGAGAASPFAACGLLLGVPPPILCTVKPGPPPMLNTNCGPPPNPPPKGPKPPPPPKNRLNSSSGEISSS